jgi:60 kDa SS-A/Ro ribonucleoprotein
MAMATLRSEPWSAIYGFDHTFKDLKISATDDIDAVMKKTNTGSFGSTNMSLPMEFAMQQNWKVDSFEVYTDNDINSGRNAPSQALKNYRSKMGIHDAKLIAVGCAVNNFTIADPKDKGMLDVVGFDSQAPQFIAAFVAGLL